MKSADFRMAIESAITQATAVGTNGKPVDADLQLMIFIGALEGQLACGEPALARRLSTVGRVEIGQIVPPKAA